MFMLTFAWHHVPVSDPTGPRRRQPVQERSRARVRRILAAALELLQQGGTDAVTTRAIAERAAVPIATLYQFFPNREAILSELLLDYLDRRDVEIAEVLANTTATSLAGAIHEIFEFHRAHLYAEPHLVQLFYSSRATGRLPDPEEHRAHTAGLVLDALVARGLLPPDTDPLVTGIAVELGDRIIELAYRAGPDGDRAVLAEGKLALTRYLETRAAKQRE